MKKLIADVNMGDNLRCLRKQHKFTQDRLVAQLQLLNVITTRNRYSRYETGELNIPITLLVALCQIYGCDYNAFFQGLSIPPADENIITE